MRHSKSVLFQEVTGALEGESEWWASAARDTLIGQLILPIRDEGAWKELLERAASSNLFAKIALAVNYVRISLPLTSV